MQWLELIFKTQSSFFLFACGFLVLVVVVWCFLCFGLFVFNLKCTKKDRWRPEKARLQGGIIIK